MLARGGERRERRGEGQNCVEEPERRLEGAGREARWGGERETERERERDAREGKQTKSEREEGRGKVSALAERARAAPGARSWPGRAPAPPRTSPARASAAPGGARAAPAPPPPPPPTRSAPGPAAAPRVSPRPAPTRRAACRQQRSRPCIVRNPASFATLPAHIQPLDQEGAGRRRACAVAARRAQRGSLQRSSGRPCAHARRRACASSCTSRNSAAPSPRRASARARTALPPAPPCGFTNLQPRGAAGARTDGPLEPFAGKPRPLEPFSGKPRAGARACRGSWRRGGCVPRRPGRRRRTRSPRPTARTAPRPRLREGRGVSN